MIKKLLTYSHKNFWVACLVIFWIIISVVFIKNDNCKYCFDANGHIEYSQIIASQSQLPAPRQGWETYHPPVYYLINQFLQPTLSEHMAKVRYVSVFYGVIFLICSTLALNIFKIKRKIQILILVYFASLPAFVELFTSYNNDVLAVLLSALLLLATYSYFKKPTFSALVSIFIVTILGVYTKYSFFYVIFSILVTTIYLIIGKKINFLVGKNLIIFLVIGLLSLAPYLYFHNYKATGKFFPTNFEKGFPDSWSIKKRQGFARFFLVPIESDEWKIPFEKRSFISSTIATSLFQFNYENPVLIKLGWVILTIYTFLLFCFLVIIRKYPIYLLVIVISSLVFHLCYVIYSPWIITANTRYFAWIYLILAVCFALGIESLKNKIMNNLIICLLIVGILANLFFLGYLI